MSKAFLNAIAKAFTGYLTIESYADVLKAPNYLPQCYIRIDVAHFKHLYTVFLKDVRPLISKLFKKALSLLIESRSVDEAKQHLSRILIIYLSETEGINTISGQKTHCKIAKCELKEILTGETEDLEEEFVEKNLHDEQESKFHFCKLLLIA